MTASKKKAATAAPTIKSDIPQGIVLVILGLIAFFAPIYTTYTITVILGVIVIAASIIYFVTALANRTNAFISTLFFSILGVVIGTILITHGLTLLSILVGIWFLFFGFALFHRASVGGFSSFGKFVLVIAGILAILFALGLFIGWPFTGIGILGTLVGIVLVLQGIAYICHGSCSTCK
jgi:uncharacterized membrane protein HdeD (DUF308 family)